MGANKIIKIDLVGLNLITHFEGLVLHPYFCPSHVSSIGYGTTRYPNGEKVTINDREITADQALSYLQNDIKKSELSVDAMTTDIVTQNQFNALVSFAYNCGSANLKISTLLRKVNVNPNDATIKDEFMRWVYGEDHTKPLPGLVIRREKEAELYFTK